MNLKVLNLACGVSQFFYSKFFSFLWSQIFLWQYCLIVVYKDLKLVIRSNIFLSKLGFDDPSFTVDVYHVEGISNGKDSFRNLANVEEMLTRKLKTLVVMYSIGDSDSYVVAFQPQMTVDLKEQNCSVKLYKKDVPVANCPQQLLKLHYETARKSLERRGLWKQTYSRYYESVPEKLIESFEVYRGFWFRYDFFDGRVQLSINPITSVTSRGTVWELISKVGPEAARKRLMYRNVLATQEKGKAIYQIVRLDFNKTVNTQCILMGDKKYSIKEYFKRPGGRAELADMLSDEECVIYVKRGIDGKELSMAPSLLKLVHKTDDFPKEYTLKQELTREVFLSPQRRQMLTQKFLAMLNPLQLGKLSIPFENTGLSDFNNNAGILPKPNLVFGNKNAVTPDFSNYGLFMKNTLQKLGPAKKAAFSNNELLLVYPSAVQKDTIRSFYDDCKKVSKDFFHTYLPDKPILYSYPDFDVRKEYESFKDKIDAVLSVLQHGGETDRYLNFKEWFDKPSQVLTSHSLNTKFQEKPVRYENLLLNVCAGLLGKMGGRPWILEKKLCSDFYIGLDVGGDKRARVACYTFFDGYGNYVREEWRPQRAEEIDPQELKRIVINTLGTYGHQVNSIVFHRDGQFTDSELQCMNDIKSELVSNGSLSIDGKIICVNIKKSVPYRLYDVQGNQQNTCKIGSYLILDDHRGIVANTGAPLLRQGLAQPILVETVPPFDSINIKTALEDIYYLSFMHWGSITVKMKLPATLQYADALTPFALKNIRVTGVPL